MDVLNALRHISEKRADIIYIDPPYASDTAKEVLLALAEAPYVTAQTLIIVETSLTSDFDFLEDAGYTLVREKDYHSQRHLFLRRKDGTR